MTSTPSHPLQSPTSPTNPSTLDPILSGASPTVYIPVRNTPAEVCSISCQTNGNDLEDTSGSTQTPSDPNDPVVTPPQSPTKTHLHPPVNTTNPVPVMSSRFQRSQSMRGKSSRDRRERLDDITSLSRSSSLRHGAGERLDGVGDDGNTEKSKYLGGGVFLI